MVLRTVDEDGREREISPVNKRRKARIVWEGPGREMRNRYF